MDHVKTLEKDTPDYYGSDVSSVSNIPDGFNEISREEAYVESDTSSATDGLTDGFNDRAVDDHIGPDPEAIMQSVGDGGGGNQGPVGALTDVRDAQSAYAETSEASSTAEKGSSSVPDGDDGSQPALTIDSLKEDLQEAARKKGLDDSGTKQEILDRINGKS